MKRASIAAVFALALSGSLVAPAAHLATDLAATADANMRVKAFS
jgi:hypothetical protein